MRYVALMSPMSNAERQKLHRQRLRERASLDNVSSQVRAVVERAIEAMWTYLRRPDDEGRTDGSLDCMSSIEDLRASMADGTGLLDWCRDLIKCPEDMTPAEAKAIAAVVEIANEIELTAYRTKPKVRRR